MEHYSSTEPIRERLLSELFALLLTILCQLYWRFDIVFSNWPYPLSQLADPRVSEASKDTLRARFWGEPACCLDADFGVKAPLAMLPMLRGCMSHGTLVGYVMAVVV